MVVDIITEVDTSLASGVAQHQRPEASTSRSLLSAELIVIALTVFGAALRFGTLNVQSIWGDEAATMILVHRGFTGMLSHLAGSESSPPLYYVLVWAWTKLFGAGPLGFRSFSALIGTLTIPVLYAAGKQVSPRVGIWAAALTVLNPAMYYYSQEARCYALLILFSAAALVCWQRALAEPDRRRLALWSAMSVLAVLTHYFAAFLFIPEAVILAMRLGWRRVLIPTGFVALVGIALMPLAAAEANGKASWIEATSLGSRVAETVKQFLVGLYGPAELITAALSGILAAGAVILLWRYGRREYRGIARDMAVLAAVGVGLPLLLAAVGVVDVFDGRNVIAAWIPCAVLVAIGLGAVNARHMSAAIGGCLLLLSLAAIIGVNALPEYQRDDWRGVAQALSPASPGRIIIGEASSSLPLSIYMNGLVRVGAAHVTTREIDVVGLRTRRTGRPPLSPAVSTTPPSGFRLAGLDKTKTYAAARFIAANVTTIQVGELRRTIGQPRAEIILQR
jgi:mannosyltransferase